MHYSLPRDDKGDDKNNVGFLFYYFLYRAHFVTQQLQGCLHVTLRNSPSGSMIDDNEVRRKFQQFGDVKSIQPVGDRIEYVFLS